MFLKKTMERNGALIEAAAEFHRKGLLLPDTFLVDMDTLLKNAAVMKAAADRSGVRLYFMLKQLGRNPEIARRLMRLGFDGAVAVDFREALSLIRAGVPLGNVGHLVQIPKGALTCILSARPQYVTVYSVEKAREIDEVCRNLGFVQKLMLRVIGKDDVLYPGQYGGFRLEELEDAARKLAGLGHVRIAGLTSFPCFLFNERTGRIEPTPNAATLQAAKKILSGMGVTIEEVNMPSATCCASIPLIRRLGGTHGEPGHGLSGTTPLHAVADCAEIPCVVYLSEISHNYGGRAYCYGGGHYRRSHVRQALVGPPREGRLLDVIPPADESIDYHFGLAGTAEVSQSVVMAFRTQIFVTRSSVALIDGLASGRPAIRGIFSPLGQRLK